jgi:hypothetical protein
VKEQLQNEIAPVCARILGQQDMPLNVATQALRVLMPLSTASCKAGLAADEQVVSALIAILRNPAARLRFESLKTPAERAVAAQAHKASVMIAFNLTSVKRALLVERGLSRALVCVVEAETPTLCLSTASALHAELALKGLYNLGKVSSDSWAHELSKDGMLTAACAVLCMSAPQSSDGAELEGGLEAAKARCVRVKLLVLRALMRAVHDLSKTEQLASVLLEKEHGQVLCGALSLVMIRTPEVLSSMDLERMQEPGERVENEDGWLGGVGQERWKGQVKLLF